MKVRALLVATCLAAITAGAALAQPPTPPAAPLPSSAPATLRTPRSPTPAAAPQAPAPPAEPAAPPARRREGQPVNIKIDVTITDQRSGTAPVKKTLSVVVADGWIGQIRSQGSYAGVGTVPLNVDAEPDLIAGDKIRLRFNIQYDLPSDSLAESINKVGSSTKTSIHDTVTLILESGKPVVAAQSADPVGDRQVIVEVKATIMR